MNSPKYYSNKELNFDVSLISESAVTAVKTLTKAGYSSYLVGGCIRDLMLGIRPKDFDISTQATPNQIRRLFPRSRIIGQRFKIVHVTIKGELLEIATFRQSVKDHHKDRATGQVLDDNVFGSMEEDAARRDFTINAFYYDVNKHQVIDFFDGKRDLGNQRLRLIGDPDERFAEDPGRILRTVRFQAKFNFDVSQNLADALYRQKHLLRNIPPARRFDEVLKLFYCGQAEQVWTLLNDYDLLPYLFAFSDDTDSDEAKLSRRITRLALQKTDQRIREDKTVISSFMFCAILWPYFQTRFRQLLAKKYDPQEAMIQAAEQVIAEQLIHTGMLRRVSNTIREIWWLQYRLEKSKKRQLAKILNSPRFRAAYDFFLVRAECGDADPRQAQFWTDIQETDHASVNINQQKPAAKRKKPRRQRRRNCGSA